MRSVQRIAIRRQSSLHLKFRVAEEPSLRRSLDFCRNSNQVVTLGIAF